MPINSIVPADDGELLEQDDQNNEDPSRDEEDKALHSDEEEDEGKKGADSEEDNDVDEEDEDEGEGEKGKKDEEGKKGEEEETPFGSRRPTYKEVKEKYPKFFSDFPGLRDAFFREGEYEKVFPTVEDAKDAQDELGTLQDLRDKVLSGDIAVVLESTRDADVRAFDKLVDNLLPALYKIDSDAFSRAVTPSIENLVRTAYREGLGKSDEDLQSAALGLSSWFFGTEDVARGVASSDKTRNDRSSEKQHEQEERLNRDRKDFEAQRFRDAYNVVYSDCNDALRGEIAEGLDPDDELSPYVKEKLIDDIMSAIDKELQKDPDHLALMNSKWRRARQDAYNRESLHRIVGAYRARAKSLIPSVRSRLKSKALGISAKKARNADELRERKEIHAGGVHNGSSRNPSPREIDWGQTSDADILAGNIRTRKGT